MPTRFAFRNEAPQPLFSKRGRGEIFKSFQSLKEFCKALMFDNLAKKISGLKNLISSKNRKGLSMILEKGWDFI